jgi:hypothetical protein
MKGGAFNTNDYMSPVDSEEPTIAVERLLEAARILYWFKRGVLNRQASFNHTDIPTAMILADL